MNMGHIFHKELTILNQAHLFPNCSILSIIRVILEQVGLFWNNRGILEQVGLFWNNLLIRKQMVLLWNISP
jgi:hypothetical protein